MSRTRTFRVHCAASHYPAMSSIVGDQALGRTCTAPSKRPLCSEPSAGRRYELADLPLAVVDSQSTRTLRSKWPAFDSIGLLLTRAIEEFGLVATGQTEKASATR